MENAIDINEVVIKYEYLIKSNIKRHFSNFIYSNDYDDLLQEGRIAIVKAYKTYKPMDNIDNEKSFIYYCSKCIYNSIITYINRKYTINNKNILSLNEIIQAKEDDKLTLEDMLGDYDDETTLYIEMYLQYVKNLGGDYYIIFCYMLRGYNGKEISEILNKNYRIINKKMLFIRENLKEKFNIKHEIRKSKGSVIAFIDGKLYKNYDNLQMASEELGIDKNSIRKICQGLRKSAKSKILNKKINFEWGE